MADTALEGGGIVLRVLDGFGRKGPRNTMFEVNV